METVDANQTVTGLQSNFSNADRVEITFYTDPLCCWSWAFEPQWRRLQFEFRNGISFRYVMGGLLPSWKNYNDPLFSVSRPMQMGPVWLEASTASGMPVHDKIWVHDPPASSYPACIAVKCAQLQSAQAGVIYLRRLREAVMLGGKNIARKEVLTGIAGGVASDYPGLLDVAKFSQDLTNDNGLEAFRADLNEVQSKGITRFPTLIIRGSNRKALMLTGYRPYMVLLEAIRQVAPAIEPAGNAITAEEYSNFWGSLTQRELDEVIN